MSQKVFKCKACGDTHEVPINSKCQKVNEMEASAQDEGTVGVANAEQMDINKQILSELKQLKGRITNVEEKVENQDKGLMVSSKFVRSNQSAASQGHGDGDLILLSLSRLSYTILFYQV